MTAAALALEEFGPEYAPLRAARKAKVLAAMEREGVDALLLGRIGNGKYVAGHRGLWRAVLGSFAPLVLLIRSTGGIHLAASTWDDGIPAEIPHDDLTGLTWNPRDAIAGVVRAEGLADCKRIGADGMSPGIAGLLEMLAPGVELVDGERLMRDVRRVKLPAEIEVMRTALSIARDCLASTLAQLRPGVTEQAMQGAFLAAMTSYGLTVPSHEGTFRVLDAAPPRPGASDRVVAAGDRFGISAGVMYAGYEADIVHGDAAGEPRALTDVISACQPGARPSEVLAAWKGESQSAPLVVGLGIGVEPPIIGGPGGLESLDDEPLVAGMVLGLQAWTGGALHGAMIHVTERGPVPL